MRKLIISILTCFLFLSCQVPRYSIQNNGQLMGLDFSKGRWLLNEIDCPPKIYNRLNELVKNDFKLFLTDSLSYIYNVKGLILPQKVPLNPDLKMLKQIKLGSGFDYFINIKALISKDNIGSVDFTPHDMYKSKGNNSEVIIEVYDLNLLQIIYSKKVIGSVVSNKDNKDVHFSKTGQELVIGAYKKIIKDIDEKSIKKTIN